MDFSQNYFELFEQSESFEIDLATLSARFRDLQRAFHPDKFASAPDQERRLSLQKAAQINSAYQTLKAPLSRAHYLLELRGLDQNQEQLTIKDPEFLEEQMELRENLAEIRHGADPQTGLVDFSTALDAKVKACINELREQFALAEQQALLNARDVTYRLQFLQRLQQDVEALEEELY